VGGGILVARRARLAGRCNPLFSRRDEHARRFGADAGPPRADAGAPRADAGAPRADAGAPRADAGRNKVTDGMLLFRHQHGFHLRGDAGLLVTDDPRGPH